ncbi:hypothetical protein Cgig2_007805 [Carnegiea gigantea]|uniref:Uncharacterized protein n=1 Tax=Carnegiea gigantea TaxID=171969 RepID=A0A9Q1JM97_9CARY|nr:hypothetical protein Cgig2_007805 [Carnegiea gigantea]
MDRVYVAIDNLYIPPPEMFRCQERQNNQTSATHPNQCTSADARFNSIFTLDLAMGSYFMAPSAWKEDHEERKEGKYGGQPQMEIGSTDTNIVNSDRVPFRLAPLSQTTTAGAWVALDANISAMIYGGASVSYGCVYVEHGHMMQLAKFHPTCNRGNSLFAFHIAQDK